LIKTASSANDCNGNSHAPEAGLGGMAGLLGGLFGVGGGFLVIPLLGFFYGLDAQTAQAPS
jgi:hypothetical protein